jgi:D-glycero-beta-D-manno-heptose-7-phosphate kinase
MIEKNTLAKARILVVGDTMLDRYWFGSVDRISPEAPVPIVKVTGDEERMGAAANVAYNAVCLGAQASLLSVVGDDADGHKVARMVKAAGIAGHFGFDPTMPTTVKLRVISRHQQLMRIDFESQPETEILASLLGQFEALIEHHDAVLFSDYGKGGLAHVANMIELAKRAGKPVLIDPKGTDYSRYAGATILTPNRSELMAVTGPWHSEQDLHTKAQALRHTLNIDALLLTRSEEGMTLFDDNGAFTVAAQARDVFDVTGAGDTVIATLASLVAAKLPLREAMALANKAGGIVVGKFGTATLSYEELAA